MLRRTVIASVTVFDSSDPPDSTRPHPALHAEHHCFLSRTVPFEPPLSTESVPGWDGSSPAERTRSRHRPSVRSTRSRHRVEPGSVPHYDLSRAAALSSRTPVPIDARSSADLAMRMLIEVMDRRRNADQLAPMFTTGMVDLVRTIVRNPPPGSRLGFAAVHQVHVVFQSNACAEVFGSYTRGPRMFAFAARIEMAIDQRRPGWTVTSLRVG